jgi:tetratricopeptide (TPR) repeat protein
MLDNPEVGTIILTKMGDVSGYTISTTSLMAPKDAVKCYENGVKASKKMKWGKARSELEKAVEIHPEYAEAWFALGEVFEAEKKPERASEAYNKAIEADSQYVYPYIKLAMMDARNSKWTEAAERTGQVLKMNPYDFGDAYYLHSMANLNLNKLTEAESSARKSIELDVGRKHPQAEQILGLALALQNKYGEASEHLHTYLELLPDAPNAETVRGQIAQLEGLMAQQGGTKTP